MVNESSIDKKWTAFLRESGRISLNSLERPLHDLDGHKWLIIYESSLFKLLLNWLNFFYIFKMVNFYMNQIIYLIFFS